MKKETPTGVFQRILQNIFFQPLAVSEANLQSYFNAPNHFTVIQMRIQTLIEDGAFLRKASMVKRRLPYMQKAPSIRFFGMVQTSKINVQH